MTKPTILIVDDEVRSLEALERTLFDDFDVLTAETTAEAERLLADNWVQVILCDQRMPEETGVAFLTRVRDRWPDVIRIIISGYTEADDIIAGLNEAGIYHYITKPWQPEKLILTLKNALEMFELQRQNQLLAIELRLSEQGARRKLSDNRRKLRRQYDFDDGIVRAQGSPMNRICDTLARVAPYDLSVLFLGESGTGKELAARAIHYNSLRWNKPFAVQACQAVDHDRLERELFGVREGHARADQPGVLERAFGGTLFLDEVAEMPLSFQARLLRVMQEGEYRPLGSNQSRKLDIRIIAATSADLEKSVAEGCFRKDLYFRLAGVTIAIPPLRERREDVPILANYLLKQATASLGKEATGFSPEALSCLKRHDWPGNVRELRNEIERMLVMGPEGGELGADVISPRVLMALDPAQNSDLAHLPDGGNQTLKERVEAIEARILRESLIRHRWNKSRAARELGLSRVGLRSKLKRYGIEREAGLAEASSV
ncbi:sigma-54-dependent transcriptional regulator [Profundibacter sp.]|uniref:sigma-54-dependent transcriptional regulator n=1 Tax=Profundibacter sp. TaxID=3101071 RepID=UPI003D127363